ncbi:MAG: endonuclease domain-containing protein [candidate division KSB1 bacterium]|nr:endonuclease domain-containing protein [candidate division KSB1 bacterium]
MTKIYNKTNMKERRRELRNHMTPEEIILWSKLKNKQLDGFKFKRQASIHNYIVDFYCPKQKLAIELDGQWHFEKETQAYDQTRQNEIEQEGIQILRFTNKQLRENLTGVLEIIRKALLYSTP